MIAVVITFLGIIKSGLLVPQNLAIPFPNWKLAERAQLLLINFEPGQNAERTEAVGLVRVSTGQVDRVPWDPQANTAQFRLRNPATTPSPMAPGVAGGPAPEEIPRV